MIDATKRSNNPVNGRVAVSQYMLHLQITWIVLLGWMLLL